MKCTRHSRARHFFALAGMTLVAMGCGGESPADACGLSGTPPSEEEVVNGFLRAATDEGNFSEMGSWSSGSNGDITAGTLSMIIANDESASAVSELVGRGAFPICVPLGERSPSSGNATYDSRFVTDASHTGMVAILGEDAGMLFGRFEVELKDGSGGSTDTFAFREGVFRLPAR